MLEKLFAKLKAAPNQTLLYDLPGENDYFRLDYDRVNDWLILLGRKESVYTGKDMAALNADAKKGGIDLSKIPLKKWYHLPQH